jgi:hypothetical protein
MAMAGMAGAGPLAGVRVLEVALGVSAVGSGLAVSLPGSLLRDLGAEVARLQSAVPATLDAGLQLSRAWNRGKDVAEVDDVAAPEKATATIIENGTTRGGPLLDAGQTGYGAAYRIYQGADSGWLALAIPDQRAWPGSRHWRPSSGRCHGQRR